MDRLIPTEKLRAWAYAEAPPEVRLNRKRWMYSYMMGASFWHMVRQSRHPRLHELIENDNDNQQPSAQ